MAENIDELTIHYEEDGKILRKEVAKVLSQLMAERKITITLARTAVLVFDQRLSVTSEVLKRLDKNLPNVAVDFKNPDAK